MFFVMNSQNKKNHYFYWKFLPLNLSVSILVAAFIFPSVAAAQVTEGPPKDLRLAATDSIEVNVGNAVSPEEFVDLLGDNLFPGNADAAAPAQIVNSSNARVSQSLNQQLAAFALEDASDALAATGPGILNGPGSALSMFIISGVQHFSHDGYDVSSVSGNGRTANFDETDYGLTLGMRLDASEYVGLDKHSTTVGFFTNYTHSDIDLGTTPALAGRFSSIGSADVDSWSVGTYGLFTQGSHYGLVTVTGTIGLPDAENAVFGATSDYNTYGFSASAMAGKLIDLGEAKLDLRGGLVYIHANGDDHTDSAGNRFRDARLQDLSGTVSVRIFTNVTRDDYKLKPFAQVGLTQRFLYDNEVTVNDEEFSFDDADTTLFGRVGFDFNLSDSTQAYVAVRGDINEDVEAIAGQVGMTIKLD